MWNFAAPFARPLTKTISTPTTPPVPQPGAPTHCEPSSTCKATTSSRLPSRRQPSSIKGTRCSSPHILAVQQGTQVDFRNSDAIYHNVFSFSKTKRFDLDRYPKGRSRSVVFDRLGVVRVFCEIHSHMSAFVLVLPHSYFATTDATRQLSDPERTTWALRPRRVERFVPHHQARGATSKPRGHRDQFRSRTGAVSRHVATEQALHFLCGDFPAPPRLGLRRRRASSARAGFRRHDRRAGANRRGLRGAMEVPA